MVLEGAKFTEDGTCPYCGSRDINWLGSMSGAIQCFCNVCSNYFYDNLRNEGKLSRQYGMISGRENMRSREMKT